MRYLAIDHGQKRTGLAVSDASETLVSPYSVIETTCEAELLRRILDVMKTEEIEAVVVGLPVNMDGTEGTRVKQVKQFVEKLRQQTSKPIQMYDERLSSFEAGHLAGEETYKHRLSLFSKKGYRYSTEAVQISWKFFRRNLSRTRI
ncbi:MAG: Holliday junction resolvase RuvX [Planctomycetota bacterium]|jgi:putative Holliday junction resolvase